LLNNAYAAWVVKLGGGGGGAMVFSPFSPHPISPLILPNFWASFVAKILLIQQSFTLIEHSTLP